MNQLIEQPYALSPTMTDAPPPPYSSLYPVFGPMPSINSALPPMSPFFPPQPNHPLAAHGAPQPTPLIAPPVPSNRPFPHHPQHQLSAAAVAAAVANNISPQVNFGHMYPHGTLPHFIPTPTAAASQFVYQTVVPTTYGPVVMPVQIPNNTPPPMIGIPSDCYVDPRTAARFDDIARGTIPVCYQLNYIKLN